MIRWLALLRRDRQGSAAAEMALVTPLLAILMFGSLELGKFFWDEHIVTKAVRDGARFASRQKFGDMPCGGTAANETQIKNIVRYGKATVTTETPRLYYWTSATTVTVSIQCYDNAGTNGARVYDGIYTSRGQVPVVRVTASVPYTPIVGSIGFSASNLSLNARSEATVFGI